MQISEAAQRLIHRGYSGGDMPLILFLTICFSLCMSCSITPITTDNDLKVAFIGDQGYGNNAREVLKLIKAEGADVVIHQGDYDYRDSPGDWESMVTDELGQNFPYFGSPGNHDDHLWYGPNGYQTRLRAMMPKDATCSGDLGVKSACSYQGLFFILSGAGTLGSGHTDYITWELQKSNAIWKICTWHKNQRALQLGDKRNAVGWGPYEACREGGAIIITAHEPSYAPTRTLSNTERQIVSTACPDRNRMCVPPGDTGGETFVVVSGLGGKSIRNQDRCLPTTYPYGCNNLWAMIYTSDQGANYGVLFITFNVDDNPYKAHGIFKNINNETVDKFEITKTRAP